MKKYLQILCFSIFVNKAYPQASFNVAIQKENNTITANMIGHQGNLYFADIERLSGAMSSKMNIYSYTNAGNLRFSKTVNVNGVANIAKILATTDDKIAIFYSGFECHVPQIASNYFMKLDTNGSTIAASSFSNSSPLTLNMKDALQLQGGDFLAISQKKIYRLNSSGVLTMSAASSFDTLTCVGICNNSVVACGTSAFYNGINNFVINPSNLYVTANYTVSNYYRKIVKDNTRYFGLTVSGVVEAMDSIFQTTASSGLIQNFSSGNQILDFSISNDTLFMCGTNPSNTSNFHLKADTNLNMVSNFTNTTLISSPAAITTDAGNSYVLFNNQPLQYQYTSHIFLAGFRKNGQFNITDNISLDSVSIPSTLTARLLLTPYILRG